MTVLEAIMQQREQFNSLFHKNFSSIEAIVKQQEHIDKLLPKSIIDLTNKMDWIDKISNIKHNVPEHSKSLNLTNFVLDSSISGVIKSLNWMNDFQFESKKYPEFENLFKFGQKYNLNEWDFSETFEDFDRSDEQSENLIETPTSIIITETYRVKEIIREIYLNNVKLFSIHPREFEKIIAELLYNQGFDVELTKQTRDNGYDILALKYIDNFSPIKYLVECKRYSEKNKVGIEIVRSFKEVIATEQANKGIIVTSSYFTLDAINKQKETPYLLDYKNKDEVINWVNEYMNKKTYR
jgi:restriction system protein